MTGHTYLEHGQPVTVLARWRHSRSAPLPASLVLWLRPPSRSPRNVLIQRADGSKVVRPFRGLRRPKEN